MIDIEKLLDAIAETLADAAKAPFTARPERKSDYALVGPSK